MSDLVARLREYTCGYCNDRPFLVTDEAADEIERLKSELAAANAKIARVKEVADKNGRMTADLFSDDKPAYALYGYFEASLRTALADPAPGEPK